MTNEEKIAKILAMQEVTTKNVDALAADFKEMVATLPQFARVDEKYKSMDKRLCEIEEVMKEIRRIDPEGKRLNRLEGVLMWTAKIVGTAVLMAILGTVVVAK